MNKELMEALDILEKEKEISKRLYLSRLRIPFTLHAKSILAEQTISR